MYNHELNCLRETGERRKMAANMSSQILRSREDIIWRASLVEVDQDE